MEISREFEETLAGRIQENLNTMQVILGPRQVGKSTGVGHVFQNCHFGKVTASADLPSPPTSEWILQHWNTARSKAGPVLLVLDEVHKIPRWSETIKMLFDRDRKERRMRVILLGSASLSLGSGLSETLAGRFEVISVPHWSYPEMRKAFGWNLDAYYRYGGYPSAADFVNDPSRWQGFIRDSIIEPVLSRDIFGLVSIKKPALLRQTLELAMHYPSQVLSYQKFIGQLVDPGNISTVQHYLEILEAAFLLKRIFAFSGNMVREKSSSPKLLPLCPALVHAFVDPGKAERDETWIGHLIELVVGATLIKHFRKVSYWRKHNAEVDYVVSANEKTYAIEVKAGHVRTKSGLASFLREFPDAVPLVIDEENIEAFLTDPLSFFGSSAESA